MNGWKRSAVCTMLMLSMIVCILFCGAGCGVQQEDQTEDVSQIATGAAVYIDEKQSSEAVQHQLELLVKKADKWRIGGDADGNNSDEINYAVTDLDHNGRLEILVDVDCYDAEESAYLRCYEVNESGDGIEEIDTAQAGEYFLEGLVEHSDTVYYDPKTEEYHYVMANGWDCVEYDLEEDDTEETEDEGWITAWTLKEGQITQDVLGYWVEIAEEEGGTENRYYHVNDKNTYLVLEEYSEVNPEDISYSGCGKLTVRISDFHFDHSLEDMTEKQMYHALEKSYGEFFGGYPLEKQKMSVSGQKVAIPQYSTIQDSGKQKRVNQMIYDWVEEELNSSYSALQDPELDLDSLNVDITIEYAGRARVSLLLEAVGYGSWAAYANESYDTITIDLEQEKILTSEDIIPEKYRDQVEENIVSDEECEGFHGGDAYLEAMEDEDKLFPTRAAEGWQDVKIYQTRDKAGVVIPVKCGLDSYVIYEVPRDWDVKDTDGGIAYSDVDWEAYQYKLLAPEYQRLQDYMSVLTGETELIWEPDMIEVDEWKDQWLYSIAFCDVTQDGQLELILEFSSMGGFYLILHQEGERFYGIDLPVRWFERLQENGIYCASGGSASASWHQMRFDGDAFVTEELASYDGNNGNHYSIGEKEVGEKEFEKWEDNALDSSKCKYYTPEALPALAISTTGASYGICKN